MKGKRYSEEQIVRVLTEIEAGKTVAAVCQEHNVSEQTVYRWKSKYGGLEQKDVHRLKELEDENARLKRRGRSCLWTTRGCTPGWATRHPPSSPPISTNQPSWSYHHRWTTFRG